MRQKIKLMTMLQRAVFFISCSLTQSKLILFMSYFHKLKKNEDRLFRLITHFKGTHMFF